MYPKKLFILLITLLIILLSLPACTSNQDGTKPLPRVYPEKHPKLDSHLLDLIEAEKRGEGEAEALVKRWARSEGMEDSRVIVTITGVPEQVEAAKDAAIKAGAQRLGVGTLGTQTVIEAFVPIASLEALANEESILSIRLPVLPAEG